MVNHELSRSCLRRRARETSFKNTAKRELEDKGIVGWENQCARIASSSGVAPRGEANAMLRYGGVERPRGELDYGKTTAGPPDR